MSGPTEKQKQQIIETCHLISHALSGVNIQIAASALMICAADCASQSQNTDNNIVEQFKTRLAESRNHLGQISPEGNC